MLQDKVESLYKQGNLTVPVDLDVLFNHLNINVFDTYNVLLRIDYVDGELVVYLPKLQQSIQRTRYRLAHVLGHIILHFKPSEPFIEGTTLKYPIYDTEADAFADALLVPQHILSTRRTYSTIENAHYFNVLEDVVKRQMARLPETVSQPRTYKKAMTRREKSRIERLNEQLNKAMNNEKDSLD